MGEVGMAVQKVYEQARVHSCSRVIRYILHPYVF